MLQALTRTRPRTIGGCDFAVDPNISTRHASVQWRATLDPNALTMSALPPDWDLRPPAHWWGAASSQTSDDGDADDVGGSTDEALLGQLSSPDVQAGVVVPIDDLLPQRLAAILAWWRSQDATAKLPPELTLQRRHRLVLGLRALDGVTDGASHREIARGLFGPSNVPTGPAWKSHHLRSRIVRLIHDAKALREHGYRNLLRSARTVRF